MSKTKEHPRFEEEVYGDENLQEFEEEDRFEEWMQQQEDASLDEIANA